MADVHAMDVQITIALPVIRGSNSPEQNLEHTDVNMAVKERDWLEDLALAKWTTLPNLSSISVIEEARVEEDVQYYLPPEFEILFFAADIRFEGRYRKYSSKPPPLGSAERKLRRKFRTDNELPNDKDWLFCETNLGSRNFLFAPRPRDIAHSGSGSAQSLLRICSGLLTLNTIFGRLRRSMLNCFNSSQVGPELVPYIKIAKMGLHF
jgi:hypothetical protein